MIIAVSLLSYTTSTALFSAAAAKEKMPWQSKPTTQAHNIRFIRKLLASKRIRHYNTTGQVFDLPVLLYYYLVNLACSAQDLVGRVGHFSDLLGQLSDLNSSEGMSHMSYMSHTSHENRMRQSCRVMPSALNSSLLGWALSKSPPVVRAPQHRSPTYPRPTECRRC